MATVHHITPARKDKNLGLAINSLIKGLPDKDWICLRDIDTLPVNHVKFIEQCENIANDNEFQLVSCMTNRLGLTHQLVGGESSTNTDIQKEIDIGTGLEKQWGSHVSATHMEVAGLMMLFPVWVWESVGGFREGGIIHGSRMLDNVFYEAVKKKGYKVGIANGIYLFHLYRWGKPRTDKTHLR